MILVIIVQNSAYHQLFEIQSTIKYQSFVFLKFLNFFKIFELLVYHQNFLKHVKSNFNSQQLFYCPPGFCGVVRVILFPIYYSDSTNLKVICVTLLKILGIDICGLVSVACCIERCLSVAG